MSRRMRSESGLTLIETIAAISIFAIMTVGITPLLAGSMRGSNLSRSYTRSRNIASEGMERARGLPFFESVNNQSTPTRKDVLDLYFPDLSTGYSSTDKTFTTTCTPTSSTPAASGSLACPKSIPAGHTVVFLAQFVQPGGVNAAGEQLYVAVPPDVNPATGTARVYSWNDVTTELPPSSLLRLVVTLRWTFAGSDKEFAIESFLGDRRLAPNRVQGSARIDYILQTSTSFVDTAGMTSTLVGTIGNLDSSISGRSVVVADQMVRAGRFVHERYVSGEGSGETLAEFVAGEKVMHAPPNENPAAAAGSTPQSIDYPGLSGPRRIAYLNNTTLESSANGVQVVNDLPKAFGRFIYSGGNNEPSIAMDSDKVSGVGTVLQLSPDQPVLFLERGTAGQARVNGTTSSEATALVPSASRKVESIATAAFSRLRLFPVEGAFIGDSTELQTILIIADFTMSLRCSSTASNSAETAGTWSAQLRYWRDSTNNGITDGAYATLQLSGSVGTAAVDPIPASVGNPLVHDAVDDSRDVHLFKTDSTPNGYLEELKSNPNITATKDSSGRTTEVNITDAIQIVTVPTDETKPESGVSISIGNASCRSADRRGLVS